jgi:DNA polymerase I
MAFPEVPLGTPEFKKLRSLGKRVNFAMIYGASLYRVQQTLGDIDPDTVAKLYYGFNDRFRTVKVYGRWVSTTWFKNNGYVTNLLGRRYYMTDDKDVYKLQNYLIQGSSADIIKEVIIRVDEYLRKHRCKTKVQGCIHDELCICVAEGEHDVIYKIKEIMENTVKLPVPLVAEISVSKTNWAEKKGE